MPYVREGKCVYKKNPDGSKGKSMGCSDTEEKAKAHMRALYAAENKSYAEFSMVITKASIPDKASRQMRLTMVTSDTGEDVFEERMSQELFDDFVERIENGESVPSPFDTVLEDGWNGGMPYLSISHYKSGAGQNVPGEPEKVYRDGERLKSTAVLYDNPLGQAVWKSVCTDLDERDKPLEERSFKNPVRISIGFLDLQHKHEIGDDEDYIFTRSDLGQKCEKCEEGINGKVYLKGQLVHLAFTRVPANPRTQVEVYRMGDEIETKKQDAESIVGELVDELVGKSVVEDDAMVTKKQEKDYRQYANDVERAFSKEFSPPPQPSLYVRSGTDKNVLVVEYDPSSDYMEANKVYRIGYTEKDGKFSFDKRSDWEEMEYGLMPKRSKATDDEWEIKFENKPQPDKSVTEDKPEAIMDETQVLEQEPVVEEEQVTEEEKKPETVQAAPASEPTELEKSAAAVVQQAMELAKQGKFGADALKEIQPMFNQFGETVKKSLAVPAGYVDEDALAAKVAEKMVPVMGEMIAKAMSGIQAPIKPEANLLVPRSLNLKTEVPQEGEEKLSQIQKIANKSVGM